MSELISNTQQKVTDAYRNNPFWDKCPWCGMPGHTHDCIPEILEDINKRANEVKCDVCDGELNEDGICKEQLRQQVYRT
jgi:CRISPR/Cas system-associated protein Cas10 (large subunit of type III CRISPR-Cas system)